MCLNDPIHTQSYISFIHTTFPTTMEITPNLALNEITIYYTHAFHGSGIHSRRGTNLLILDGWVLSWKI